MMTPPALILGLAFVTAILLFVFFLGVSVVREFARSVRAVETKAKREDHSRLALGDDGELVDLWEEEADHTQRSRNS